MIKLLLATIFVASQIWSDPGITIDVKVIVPDVKTGAPEKGKIYGTGR